MNKFTIKSEEEIKIMVEGGKKLARVKNELKKKIKKGNSTSEIESLAVELISKEGGEPSFMMVPNYHWATCVNVNEGLVHGVPAKNIVFNKGDVVSVDVGFYYKGFHTDTSFTVALDPNVKVKKFLETGKLALKKAIQACREGNFISDISAVIEKTVSEKGYAPIRALSGHGVGKELHEDPMIPCFVSKGKGLRIRSGMALAIEVMYTMGKPDVVLAQDGWTISVRDGKISALYEETVAVTHHGLIVLTES